MPAPHADSTCAGRMRLAGIGANHPVGGGLNVNPATNSAESTSGQSMSHMRPSFRRDCVIFATQPAPAASESFVPQPLQNTFIVLITKCFKIFFSNEFRRCLRAPPPTERDRSPVAARG